MTKISNVESKNLFCLTVTTIQITIKQIKRQIHNSLLKKTATSQKPINPNIKKIPNAR